MSLKGILDSTSAGTQVTRAEAAPRASAARRCAAARATVDRMSRGKADPAAIQIARAEQIAPRETFPDVITARALTSLSNLLGLAHPSFGPHTRSLFHKGREHVDELSDSAALWHHDVVIHQSDTDPSGVVLEISNLRVRSKS